MEEEKIRSGSRGDWTGSVIVKDTPLSMMMEELLGLRRLRLKSDVWFAYRTPPIS